MTCPFCGYENIAGAEECAECQASLSDDALPSARTAVEHSITTDLLSSLDLPTPECLPAHTSVADAIQLMRDQRVGCVLITDERQRLTGIFTERDVLYRIAGKVRELASEPVGRHMTRNPTTLPPWATIAHALHLQSVHGFRHIPVVDQDGRPVGVVSFRRIGQFIEEIW